MNYGLQLYTLRDLTATDMADVLEKVAKMGYTGVELAGFGNLDAHSLADVARENNLTLISAHVGLADLENNLEGTLEWAQIVGLKRLVIPGIDGNLLDEDTIEETAARINPIVDKLEEEGIILGYHNHEFEFQNDRIENLMKACPKLQFQLDVYWAKFAGEDPVKVLRKYARRISMVHIKDMLDKENVERSDPNPPVLTGAMDIKGVIKQMKIMSIPWPIVEMDITQGDSLEDVALSLENLKKLG